MGGSNRIRELAVATLLVACASAAPPAFAQGAAVAERVTFLGRAENNWVTVAAFELSASAGDGDATAVTYRGWFGHGTNWQALQPYAGPATGPGMPWPGAGAYAFTGDGHTLNGIEFAGRPDAVAVALEAPYATADLSYAGQKVYGYLHRGTLSSKAATATGVVLRERLPGGVTQPAFRDPSATTRPRVAERILAADARGVVWYWRDTPSETHAFRVDPDGTFLRVTPAAIEWPRTAMNQEWGRTVPRNWRVDGLHVVGRIFRAGFLLAPKGGASRLDAWFNADGRLTADGEPRAVIAAIRHEQDA